MKLKNFFFLFFLIFLKNFAYAQDENMIYQDKIFDNNIHTVLFHQIDLPLSPPILNLYDGRKLLLSFDDLSKDVKDFTYRIFHCNSDWQVSDILLNDYLEGFEENQINDYEFSTNTLQNYIHYTLPLPNEDVNFKLSGNYILIIYEDMDMEKIILTKKFYIVENKVNIDAKVKRPSDINFLKTGQEIDFSIYTDNYNIVNPNEEIKVIIQQNERQDNLITDLKPLFIKDNELVYDYNKENIFYANNEFRGIDIKTFKIHSEGVKNIILTDTNYHVQLYNSKNNHFGNYLQNADINGKRFIMLRDGLSQEPSIEADYVNVYFNFPYSDTFIDAYIYVLGALKDLNLMKNLK